MLQTTLRFGTLSVLSIRLKLQDVLAPMVPKVLDGDAAVLPGDGNQHRLLQVHVEYPSVGLESILFHPYRSEHWNTRKAKI